MALGHRRASEGNKENLGWRGHGGISGIFYFQAQQKCTFFFDPVLLFLPSAILHFQPLSALISRPQECKISAPWGPPVDWASLRTPAKSRSITDFLSRNIFALQTISSNRWLHSFVLISFYRFMAHWFVFLAESMCCFSITVLFSDLFHVIIR